MTRFIFQERLNESNKRDIIVINYSKFLAIYKINLVGRRPMYI